MKKEQASVEEEGKRMFFTMLFWCSSGSSELVDIGAPMSTTVLADKTN